jgi:C-terminal processing protease CtpA/Prc
MKYHNFLAPSGLALSAFLIASPAMAQSERLDANGMPITHSTPEEQAQTANLNAQITESNDDAAARDNNNKAKYQILQQQYQEQSQQLQAAQENYQTQKAAYDDRTAQYEALRERFRAERAAYHRYEWPSHFAEWRLKNDGSMMNAQVQLINGDHVGNVVAVARASDGVIEGLEVELNTDKVVWIDAIDARFDHVKGEIVTDLYASDLRHMADERVS